jgi:hypothetical protein
MYNGWGSIYWDSSVGDTAAWGLYLQQVGVADQPLVDEFTTNYIVGGDELCLAPNFDNYTSEMGAISGITSPSNGSAVFNGTSDYIEAPRPLNGSTSDYTISFWINATSGTAFAFGTDGDTTNYALAYSNASLLRWEVRGSFGTKTMTSSINPFTGEWTNVAIRVSGNTGTFYFNGSEDTSASAGPIDFSGSFFIGRYGGTALKLLGNLANVAIWNRALTSDEINSVMWKQYQDLNTAEISGLKAWYSLDSTEVFDWYGYARNQGAVIEGTTCVNNALNALAQL